MLGEAATGALPGKIRTGATFAAMRAANLRSVDEHRQRKPSTLLDYDSIFPTTSSRTGARSSSGT